MKVVRWVARFFGWLLTPIVAWAASFLGASLAARMVGGSGTGRAQLVWTIGGGALAAVVALLVWLRLLRRSPRLRETLQLEPDGTPIAAVEPESPS